MSTSGNQILNFFAPFVSKQMPHRRTGDAVFPLVMAALFAAFSSVVPVVAGYYYTGIMNFAVCTIAHYAIHQALMRGAATREPDGSLYISPSLISPTQLLAMWYMICTTVMVSVFWAWRTGLLAPSS